MRDAWIERLVTDGLLREDGPSALHTTRRWQGAMARAALRLLGDDLEDEDEDEDDLRVPIACALLEVYGARYDDDEIAEAVALMLPIELAEMSSR
jgi:hypothetical protein